jgi:hypothetical protein
MIGNDEIDRDGALGAPVRMCWVTIGTGAPRCARCSQGACDSTTASVAAMGREMLILPA